MSTTTTERNLSDFLRKSGEVLEEVNEHDVLLRRRDGHDLLLVRADRQAAVHEAVGISSSLLAWFVRSHQGELAGALGDGLPWLRFLPEEDRAAFVREFVDTIEACASLDSFDQLGILLEQWRNTAYAWSRPELLERLRSDHPGEGFDQSVPAPAA